MTRQSKIISCTEKSFLREKYRVANYETFVTNSCKLIANFWHTFCIHITWRANFTYVLILSFCWRVSRENRSIVLIKTSCVRIHRRTVSPQFWWNARRSWFAVSGQNSRVFAKTITISLCWRCTANCRISDQREYNSLITESQNVQTKGKRAKPFWIIFS